MRRRRAKLVIRARGHFSVDRAEDIRAKKTAVSRGEEAEKLAREVILPSIGCNPLDGRSKLTSRRRVPFDIVAKHEDKFWLVEVKVAFPSEEASVPTHQERRMLKLCRLLEGAGVAVVPLLLGVDCWGATYALGDFPVTSRESTGPDTDLPGIADRVVDWAGKVRNSHPA